MSILIKGMEMPVFEHQSWDIRKGADGKWYMVDTNAETSDGAWHEIVPVPPLHGRLIDANEFLKRAIGTKCFRDDFALMLEQLVGESTTIIPASEEVET